MEYNVEMVRELVEGRFWASVTEVESTLEENGFEVLHADAEVILIQDEDENEYECELCGTRTTVAIKSVRQLTFTDPDEEEEVKVVEEEVEVEIEKVEEGAVVESAKPMKKCNFGKTTCGAAARAIAKELHVKVECITLVGANNICKPVEISGVTYPVWNVDFACVIDCGMRVTISASAAVVVYDTEKVSVLWVNHVGTDTTPVQL